MCMKKKSQIQSIFFSLCQKVKTKPNIKYCFLISRHSNLDEFVHADMARKTDFICQQKKGIPIPEVKSVGQKFHLLLLWYPD